MEESQKTLSLQVSDSQSGSGATEGSQWDPKPLLPNKFVEKNGLKHIYVTVDIYYFKSMTYLQFNWIDFLLALPEADSVTQSIS